MRSMDLIGFTRIDPAAPLPLATELPGSLRSRRTAHSEKGGSKLAHTVRGLSLIMYTTVPGVMPPV